MPSILISQSLEGQVSSKDGPLPYANLSLTEISSGQTYGLETDINGRYYFKKISNGTYELKVNYVGHIEVTKKITIEPESTPIIVVNINMEYDGDMVKNIPTIRAVHPLSLSLSKRSKINTLLVDQSSEDMAGSFGDPSRVLLRHPGLSISNDQTNGMVYRGISPENLKWTFEGAEVVNPNHLSNAGNLRDQASAGAGGVLAIPFDVISKFEFYGQPSVGKQISSIGGVSDFSFDQKGDSFFKLGLLGMEAGFQSKGDVNVKAHARYSTVGLLTDLGLDFGGEEIKFQDVFLRADLGKGFSTTHLMATSTTFRPAKTAEDLERYRDKYNSGYQSQILISGISYKGDLTNQSLYFSSKKDDYSIVPESHRSYSYLDRKVSYHVEYSDSETVEVWGNLVYNHVSRSVYSKASIFNAQYGIGKSIKTEIKNWNLLFNPILRFNLQTRQFRPLNFEFNVEPGLHFQLANDLSVFDFSASLSSQKQIPSVIIGESKRNKTAGATLSYTYSTIKMGQFKLSGFYNHYYSMQSYDNHNPVINGLENYYGPYAYIIEDSEAQIYGVEFMYDLTLPNGYYFNLNSSFSEATVDGQDAKFNFGHVSNLVFSKRFIKSGLNMNIGLHYRGGAFEYNQFWEEIYLMQLPDYFRMDMQIKYKFKGKNEFILDIQNVTNHTNYSGYSHKFFPNPIFGTYLALEEQLGIIPILSYKRIL